MLGFQEIPLCADVLIIGGGASGLWTASRLKQLRPDADVLVVDNGPVGWGGLMSMAEGDVDAVVAGDNMDDWIHDLSYYWDGLCEQDVIRTLLALAEDRISDYESFGSRFRRDEDGRLWGVPQRALPHVRKYPPVDRSCGGFVMAKGLARHAAALGVRQIGYVCITDLLKEDGLVCGAAGFQIHDGSFYSIYARAVVLASGPQGWDGIVNPGGWLDPAIRAGAEVRNMEFVKCMWSARGAGNPNGVLPVGTCFELVNRRGDAFMQRIAPEIGANADGSYVCRAIALEERAGNGPIRMQVIGAPEPEGTIPADLFMRFQNRPVQIGCSETLGGLATDLYGQTNLPGLFAVGRCRSIEPGVYIGGFALSTTACTGYLTGEHLAGQLDMLPPLRRAEPEQARSILNRLRDDFMRANTVTPAQARREVLETLSPNDVWLLKTEASLGSALSRLDQIRAGSLARMGAGGDLHQLKRIYDTRSTACLTELFYRASLARTESRAGHYRADHPAYDDENWLCWQHISRGPDGGYRFRKVPVPVGSYSIRPERYYSDNFRFPAG